MFVILMYNLYIMIKTFLYSYNKVTYYINKICIQLFSNKKLFFITKKKFN